MHIVEFIKLFPGALREWVRDRADGLAASIAYYQLMSMPPVVALVIYASSAILGAHSTSEVEQLISHFFPAQFITAIKYILKHSYHLENSKLITFTLVAAFSLVHGTMGYFEQIKDSIETFWDKRTEEATLKARIHKMANALYMMIVCFLIMIAGLIVLHLFHMSVGMIWLSLSIFIEVQIFFTINFFLLTYCPPEKIYWKEALPGVIITTVLYMSGRLVFRYVASSHETTEDITAALLLYLLWAYYSSFIFLYGAEFTRLYIKKKRELKNLKIDAK